MLRKVLIKYTEVFKLEAVRLALQKPSTNADPIDLGNTMEHYMAESMGSSGPISGRLQIVTSPGHTLFPTPVTHQNNALCFLNDSIFT